MKRLGVALATVLALALIAAGPSASAATNGIHPGDQTYTNGGQCTANFIFSDGANTYIGQAAHCSSTGSNTDTNGCTTQSLPLGTPVTILGANHPGTLAYNSWIAMQAAGEKDANTCAYNDLALVKIDPADAGLVSPNIPHWGGPVGLNTTGTTAGDSVYSYGNSIIRLGITAPQPIWCSATRRSTTRRFRSTPTTRSTTPSAGCATSSASRPATTFSQRAGANAPALCVL